MSLIIKILNNVACALSHTSAHEPSEHGPQTDVKTQRKPARERARGGAGEGRAPTQAGELTSAARARGR
eukprot:5257330-Prymnesium_polylepis.1